MELKSLIMTKMSKNEYNNMIRGKESNGRFIRTYRFDLDSEGDSNFSITLNLTQFTIVDKFFEKIRNSNIDWDSAKYTAIKEEEMSYWQSNFNLRNVFLEIEKDPVIIRLIRNRKIEKLIENE